MGSKNGGRSFGKRDQGLVKDIHLWYNREMTQKAKTNTISDKRKLMLLRACARALKKINIRNREQESREAEKIKN